MTDVERWQDSSRARELVRVQLAPEATDDELAWFANVSRQLDLSPFADQLVLVGRYDKRVNRKVHRPQITVAGRRALAERTGEVRAIHGPEWTGPRDERGQLNWDDLWTGDGTDYPYAARVFVHRLDWVKPANGTVKWSEFAQYISSDGSRKLSPMWTQMPSHMLGKTAESLALRRAFPNVIGAAEEVAGGWVGPDEALDVQAAAGAAYVDVVELDQPARAPAGDVSGPGASAPGPARPSQDQGTAHRIVNGWPADDQRAFLDRHGVETFGEVWPDDAVREVLEAPFTDKGD